MTDTMTTTQQYEAPAAPPYNPNNDAAYVLQVAAQAANERADAQNLCSDYDEFIETINEALRSAGISHRWPTRERTWSVSITVEVTAASSVSRSDIEREFEQAVKDTCDELDGGEYESLYVRVSS